MLSLYFCYRKGFVLSGVKVLLASKKLEKAICLIRKIKSKLCNFDNIMEMLMLSKLCEN